MEKRVYEKKSVLLRSNLELVPDVYSLEKVGAGRDGILFRYGDKVLKLLKYDIYSRKEKGLMIFEKANYFQNELKLKRITQPIDTLLDVDGMYTGYVMNYLEDITLESKKGTPLYKFVGDFTCGELLHALGELDEDFEQLTKKKVAAKDINVGSYIYTTNFLHLCDMDKYQIGPSDVAYSNQRAFQYTAAKFLGTEMKKGQPFDREKEKKITTWIKKSTNSKDFLLTLEREIAGNYKCPIAEYTQYKVKEITR